MPTESRFDDLDLREEPVSPGKLDEEQRRAEQDLLRQLRHAAGTAPLMPAVYRFDELDLREEPPVAKLDEGADAPTTTVQHTHVSCYATSCPC